MRTLITVLVAALMLPVLSAYGTQVSGYQWGTWTRENSPYNVVGKIRVPSESTLVIEPGVVVNFRGHYKFQVDSAATLMAVGTETDSIYFTTDDTVTGWHGIRFLGASSNSQLSYCRLEYGKAIGNWPHHDAGGGAICCYYSSPIISDNTIISNWAEIVGGGIYCSHSSPEISNNTISNNRASGERSGVGGGVFCIYDSDPTISGNTIRGNSAHFNGGGICCENSDPLIIGNSISANWAGWDGAGIYCQDYCHPLISNNTISGNSASGWGGGIFCYNSSPTITNTIVWGNTAPNNPQIYLEGRPVVTYCNIQGGWQGEGNIDADPIFVGAERADFHLRWRSPCIDAGLPDSLDPDGTRSDIGALYFNQDVLGIAELYPRNSPIVLPPEGGDISYNGWIFNFRGQRCRADIWTYAFAPGIGRYGPVNLYENVRIPVDSLGRNEILQRVSGAAPPGDYLFVAYVGNYPSSIIDSSYFYFSKSGSVGGGIAAWFDSEGWFKGVNLEEPNLPRDYYLSQNYPNPFNATTTINYQLPVDSYVKLEVYNTLGQKLATLVEEEQQAGYKSVSWGASSASSGIYFYKLTAGDFTETRRMMLVK
jgi:parallel beta-helix repeat protein